MFGAVDSRRVQNRACKRRSRRACRSHIASLAWSSNFHRGGFPSNAPFAVAAQASDVWPRRCRLAPRSDDAVAGRQVAPRVNNTPFKRSATQTQSEALRPDGHRLLLLALPDAEPRATASARTSALVVRTPSALAGVRPFEGTSIEREAALPDWTAAIQPMNAKVTLSGRMSRICRGHSERLKIMQYQLAGWWAIQGSNL